VAGFGFATAGSERIMAAENIRRLDIAVSSMDAPVSALSGGNQQKVVIGKWLNTDPRVMLFDEPTRGIDIQAKQQIFHIIRGLSDQGVSSIIVSSELEELMDNCHRVLILKKGRLVGEILPHQSTLEQLITVCME
jgi:ribose transport system ATP-binding protein